MGTIVSGSLLTQNQNAMQKLKVGQLVWWNDPEKETSGFYRVISDPYDELLAETDAEEEFIDDRIILIGNGYSEAEVYPNELQIVCVREI